MDYPYRLRVRVYRLQFDQPLRYVRHLSRLNVQLGPIERLFLGRVCSVVDLPVFQRQLQQLS
jgi:hypothetical protein